MDTGFANLIDDDTRQKVLDLTQTVTRGDNFVAGAYVADDPGSLFDVEAYQQQIASIVEPGGTPIIFQSFGLTQQSDDDIIESYQRIARSCDQFLAFELGEMFAPFGKISFERCVPGSPWAYHNAREPSTLRCAATWNGNGWHFAMACGRIFAC